VDLATFGFPSSTSESGDARPHAHLPRINRGMVCLGACLVAGIQLARERQFNVRVVPTTTAIEESADIGNPVSGCILPKIERAFRGSKCRQQFAQLGLQSVPECG
jgi:hypothetical protein